MTDSIPKVLTVRKETIREGIDHTITITMLIWIEFAEGILRLKPNVTVPELIACYKAMYEDRISKGLI